MTLRTPTPSEAFLEELRQAMGPEGATVASSAEEIVRVPGQTAAAWFANNQATDSRRICIVRRGPSVRDIGVIADFDPQGSREGSPSGFSPQTPPFRNLAAVARFVLDYLFGNEP